MAIDRKALDQLTSDIRRQADEAGLDGWTEIPVPKVVSPSGTLRVPRGAFEHWATWRSGGEHLAKPWRRVSPQGVKQNSDDPLHTDWMLGAGLDPRSMREDLGVPGRAEALTQAAYAAYAAVERRLLGFDCSVLLAGPAVTGRCWHPAGPGDDVPPTDADGPPVAVLADARPDWLDLVARTFDAGGAVVVERGGGMAHLVTELRGSGKGPLVRMPKALRLYPEGSLVSVDAGRGRIEMKDDGRIPQGLPQVEDVFPPEPAPYVPPALAQGAHKIRRLVRGERNPADDFRYMRLDRSMKVEWPENQAYATAHGRRDFSPSLTGGDAKDPVCLTIGIYGRGGRRLAVYYAGEAGYTAAEIRALACDALEQHEPRPDPDAYFARLRAEREAREAKLRASFDALDDDALTALVREKFEEERVFRAEVGRGEWDAVDQRDIAADFRDWLFLAEWALIDRGLEMPARGEAGADTPAP